MGTKSGTRGKLRAAQAILATARANLARAIASLDDPRRPHTAIVHELRKSMKRWRATLRLVEPFIGEEGRRLRLAARDLARALTGAREPRSAQDALADIGALAPRLAQKLAPRSIATIAARLEALRAGAETKILRGKGRGALRGALVAAARHIERWPPAQVATWALAARVAAGYRRARRAVPRDWASASDEELHELRQRVVNHRNQMEVVAAFSPKFGRRQAGAAQKLCDRLGAHQDLTVLGGYCAPHQPLAGWRSRLAPAIAARGKAHRAAAARLARRLFAQQPGAFRRRIERLWKRAAKPARMRPPRKPRRQRGPQRPR
ncbi:MAG: CHAD domain-containing protein [Proteobacteria bacterium]|nr:CHAD domain-containing protein [Pseudomonadota bacterium]